MTQGGFRLPGEAQQIDRIISTFAQCYWEDNAGDLINCPFQDQDTIFLLSFAIIMLNTDLHKSIETTATNKKSQRKRMTKNEFINNLRGVGKGAEIDREYLSTIYDEIETKPIVFRDDEDMKDLDDVSINSENIQTNISSMVDNAKSADALLRGLSIHEYRFVSLDDYKSLCEDNNPVDIIKELIRKFMEKTWHQFHGLINSAIEIAHLDPKGMESCIHLLKYSLSLCIMLDMPVEQVAFLDQLGRFRIFNARRQGDSNGLLMRDQDNFKTEIWYMKMDRHARTCCGSNVSSSRSKLEALVMLDETVNNLGFNFAFDDVGRKALKVAVRQLENAEFLLNDPNRSFVRQGNMLKRANRSGRFVEYRFFLFSDILIYAKKIPGSQSNMYRIHEELPLILMKVVDFFPPEMKKESKLGIQVYHPRKKFLVVCSTHEERKSWVTDLRESIDKELERKVAIEGARKAANNVPSGTK